METIFDYIREQILQEGYRTPGEIWHDTQLAKCKKLSKGNKEKYSRCVDKVNKWADDITHGRKPPVV